MQKNNIPLPPQGSYGTGLVFLPTRSKERAHCKEVFKKVVHEEGLTLLGWREVPIDDSEIGKTARMSAPVMEQPFIGRDKTCADDLSFERKLYCVRKCVETLIRESSLKQKALFYITNLSCRTFSYKGLLMPHQVEDFFLDLKDTSMKSALSLVHSRYSTNTFPTWHLAQPFRFLAHNGEINTLRGNINWIRARERLLASDLFGTDIEKLKPVIVEGGSDSATLDNVFELLVLSGRSLEHAMMMLIPEAWENNNLLSKELKDFYKYYACCMEPWDGPAAIAFTDGRHIGAVLDRNGLRPARYIVTKNDFVVMASEVGVLDIDPAHIKVSGRVEAGKIFFIDTELGRVVHDDEIKKNVSLSCPYGKWNTAHMIDLDKLITSGSSLQKTEDILSQLRAFGYSREDLRMIIKPMAEEGKEPVGSMGNDTPHAFLSKKPQLLYNYFKQLFAQVTNPAIDSIREKLVMSLESFVGPEKNILEESPEHSHKLRVRNPVLTTEEFEKIRDISINGFTTKTIYTFFEASGGKEGFQRALERICFEAEYAIEQRYSFIVLSDRGTDKDTIALPALLATSAVHQHLVRKNIRSETALFIESAEPREVHHFALLFGYGADCIHPYLAYEAIEYLIEEEEIDVDLLTALKNYNKALSGGILKILSKMGISTLRSYRGAQIFEALGLDNEFIDRFFTGTVSRIGGVGLDGIADETIERHSIAYSQREIGAPYLASGGVYQWKRDGEYHLWNPETILTLQEASRKNDYDRYKEFAFLINNQSQNPTTLRSVFTIKRQKKRSLSTIEPAEEIVKRFVTGAMSFGSISNCAHETLAIAMNRLGGRSNTGEGGEDPARFHTLPSGDSARSAIKQVASGRFGVTTHYLVNADELQIKIAQGAKPGEGGQLPGHKVSAIIAQTRYTTPGVTLISPPPHHDIYSIEDLAQLIFDLKNVNPRARISVKLVSEIGVGTVAAGVAKGRADMILISGGDGGTGASPFSSIKHAGLPWELGLSETHQTLVLNDLRSRVRLQTDGGMRTGRDVVIAALLGAEEYGFCTAALIVMGCVMLRHCNLDNCSLGVATQDRLLQKRFRGRADHVVNYMMFVAREVREIMADIGVRSMTEMIGRTELLDVNKSIIPVKAKGIDYSRILFKPRVPRHVGVYKMKEQDHRIADILDKDLVKCAGVALTKGSSVRIARSIKNVNRTIGATLSGEVCKRYGDAGLLDDTIYCKFTGVAGQSFGAFLAQGITFELEGLANDYVGKGISGGKIIIYPSTKSTYNPNDNILIGNTSFYGAIRGEAYIHGRAGERFCVRNSGLNVVVESVGEHGCEYMTGGRVVVLGETGRNFAAGMSGGIAYIYDQRNIFPIHCNRDMVELEEMQRDDKELVIGLLRNHYTYTGSTTAKRIVDHPDREIKKFVKVMPIEYKQMLEVKKINERMGMNEASDG
ncbi:MAG: glutamate synthase large subunit [Candidatus Omnitrophota bacterium]